MNKMFLKFIVLHVSMTLTASQSITYKFPNNIADQLALAGFNIAKDPAVLSATIASIEAARARNNEGSTKEISSLLYLYFLQSNNPSTPRDACMTSDNELFMRKACDRTACDIMLQPKARRPYDC